MNSKIFAKFYGFAFFTETGAVSRRCAKTLESHRFSIGILTISPRIALFRKNVGESVNPHDVHNFTQNPPNFAGFSDFFDFNFLGRRNQGSLQTGHAFKAQMVTHFMISMHFRGNLEIYSKNVFSLNFSCWGGIYDFLMENCTFPVSGLQNTSQMLTFIKGITPGAEKTHLGAKSALFRHRSARKHENHYFS